MANRSYLYACDVLPEERKEEDIVGISEWDYDTPIIFKFLLSGDPQESKSLIWEGGKKIAIVGDYEKGLENLKVFFNKIDIKEAQPFIKETLDYLTQSNMAKKYFILECGELYDMSDEDLESQNKMLLKNIQNINSVPVASLKEIQNIEALKKVKEKQESFRFLSKFIFRDKLLTEQNIINCTQNLGFGSWSDTLYFDL